MSLFFGGGDLRRSFFEWDDDDEQEVSPLSFFQAMSSHSPSIKVIDPGFLLLICKW